MTDYTKRLEEILTDVQFEGSVNGSKNVVLLVTQDDIDKHKSDLTQLFRDMVKEAKPSSQLPDDSPTSDEDLINHGHNQAIDQYEENLLKMIGEKE